jgi:TrmH family RNA methyltransferase
VITKNQLKFYAGLKERKARAETGLFLVEGHKVVGEGLKSACPCEAIFVRRGFSGRDGVTEELLHHPKATVLDPDDFNRLARTDNPQGMLGVFDYRPLLVKAVAAPDVLVLFDMADPRNMGTIIRTADWFGLREFVIGETCVDIFNEKVVRSTTGSIFHCRFVLADSLEAQLAAMRPEYRVVTADIGGVDYRRRQRGGKTALVFSNEARGPSEAILALTDEVITIPGGGRAESLNVAQAAAIIIASAAPPAG